MNMAINIIITKAIVINIYVNITIFKSTMIITMVITMTVNIIMVIMMSRIITITMANEYAEWVCRMSMPYEYAVTMLINKPMSTMLLYLIWNEKNQPWAICWLLLHYIRHYIRHYIN